MGIYLATVVTAAIIAIGVWAFVGLNRQEQARLQQLAASSAGNVSAQDGDADAVGVEDGAQQ